MRRLGPVISRQRRSWAALALAALALLAGGAAGTSHAEDGPRPNFIVIMADDLTVGELGAMRQTLSDVGGQGVSFSHYFISYPMCCPSRVSFLTGQYSHNHGVLGNGDPIGGYPAFHKQDSLGVWLQDAGYHTIHVGKFLNLYGTRNPREVPPGWDEWYAPPQTGAEQASAEHYFDYSLNENGVLHHYGHSAADYSTDVLAGKATDAIRRRAELGAGGQPFFMFLGSLAPHLPATPAPRDRRAFRSLRLPKGVAFNEHDVSDKPSFIRALPSISAAHQRQIVRTYRKRAASLLALDRGVASVIHELDDDGLLDNTYVVFTSDNGFFFGQHRLPDRKYLPYEPATRVPLMIRGPGIPAGGQSDELVANVDLAPTILGVAGAHSSVTEDGRSLLTYAEDPSLRSDRPILLEAGSQDRREIGMPYAGIRTPRYKYVVYRDGERELYDLDRDPRELRSRDGDPAYAETEGALAAALKPLRDCVGVSCREDVGPIPPPG